MSAKRTKVTNLDSSYTEQYNAQVQRQNRKKQRLVRRLVLFAVIVALAVGSMTVYHIKQRQIEASKQEKYEELKAELDQKQRKESDLREEIDLLNNDDYVLEIARTNYFFSKEGELIFNLPNEDPSY